MVLKKLTKYIMPEDADSIFKRLVDNGVPETAINLKEQVIEYINFIDQVMQDNENLFSDDEEAKLALVLEFCQKIDPNELMNLFIKKILPYAEQIKLRDEDFFEKNVLSLFSSLPQETVYFVYDIFINNKIDEEDKNTNWEYWEIFVCLAEKNKKTK